MPKTTRPGTVYRARSHDRHLTLRRFGVAAMLLPTAAVAWMVAVQLGVL